MSGLGSVVRRLTYIRPSTGVTSSIRVKPFIAVSGGMRIKTNAHVNDGTMVLRNAHVNRGYGVFPKTIVKTIPRSLGFRNRRSLIVINGGAAIHRFIAVRHNATSGKHAIINSGYLVVYCYRITRSYIINGGIVVDGTARLTNRIIISSCTVLNNNALMRRFARVNGRVVIRNNAEVAGSVPPCTVINHRPTTFTNVGVVNLHHHNFAGRRVTTVRSICHVVCSDSEGIASTLTTIRTRLPISTRHSRVISFVHSSSHKVIHKCGSGRSWSGCSCLSSRRMYSGLEGYSAQHD